MIIFDVETTGANPQRDQIIELCLQRGLEQQAETLLWRFKPDVPISPGAQAVHGISMSDLEQCERFAARAAELRGIFEGTEIIVGYNVEFDIGFLQNELRRAGFPELDLSAKLVVDPLQLWRKFEPRRLADAHRRFVGEEFDGAHSAGADVSATARVLTGMLTAFDLPQDDWRKVAEHCGLSRKNWIGPTHHFQWKGTVAVFGFGKHKDRPLAEVMKDENGSYLDWLIRSDFPPHVKEIALAAPNKSDDELVVWLSATYGAFR